MLLQHEVSAAAHPLAGTVVEWLWLLPLLPLLGFVINGLLSLVPATVLGPGDPDMAHGADGAHGEAGHGVAVHAHETADEHGAHGDDHHPVVRHRFAWLASIVGPAVLAIAFGLAVAMFFAMRGAGGGEMHAPFVQRYFSWMPAGTFHLDAAFQLDQLSMLMVLVITGVGTLIHLFSIGYMQDDPGYPRFFAYLNLFVAFMLVLVLGANYPVLFVGWEGVGLCSYLLIGFWFSEKANADAGKKAFIVNRIGDFGLLIAMFLLFANLGTLDFVAVNENVTRLAFGGPLITTICLFMFLGCTGKSAQIPLYIWLPDAMAGPTPVSALIHAATMVTAGVYLIARSSVLFSMAPVAGLTVTVIGALTAIFAATIGLKQWDIKKVLAYSTVSQLGYMFMGVGSGAYVAGVFHLATHAFFKALLFLGSGSVIFAMHAAYHHTGSHEDAQDMRNMGGLAPYMRVTWILMWIATLAIAGVPFFAGFFSKDEILGSLFLRAHDSTLADARWLGIPGSAVLYGAYALGLAAALLTAIYMTRMMIYTFHGPNRTGEKERDHLHEAPWIMTGPLVVLGILSAVGGWLNLPAITSFLGPVGALDRWLEPVVGESALRVTNGVAPEATHSTELALVGGAVAIALLGIIIAAVRLKPARLVPKAQSPEEHGIERVLANKYYVDEAYDRVVVEPTVGLSRGVLWKGIDQGIIDNVLVNGSARLARGFSSLGSWVQSGQIGTYAWVLVIGVLAVLGAFTIR
ncbi:MAG: NADH-quinone oxidoreductase subunit L [Gemmatimonadaceae bacterium]|nr:NADH-quinone oxidoreductase subunit L [Gemmatimonadaceae bacterium]NUR20165.1 NADH-quinone oxidoreductase subunit L [Gemmatimonadaceae bacterium]NUS98314.1 NADH-quinone oxidoreductase subunit L [Gemmatimonadaceae bacterium]